MKIVICLWVTATFLLLLSPLINTETIGIGGLKKNHAHYKKLRVEANQVNNNVAGSEKALAEKNQPLVPGTEVKTSTDLPDIPIYNQSWVKYLHYTQKDKQKAKAFYKNTAFEVQSKRSLTPAQLSASDKGGFINIPSELNFYSILYKDSLNILSSRDGFANTVDSLDLNYIKPIPEDNHFSGGIRDFGKFDEGFCFKILTKIPTESFTPTADKPEPETGVETVWVICLDKETEKTQLMNTIINLKLKLQHSEGIYLEVVNGRSKQQGDADSFNNMKEEMKFGPSTTNSTLDGYWVLLQDWAQCTLKCGGGLQYQQLMCVPPKSGGKPCEGPAIRTRPCNTQPCPQAQTLKAALNPLDDRADNNTLAPIVKMMAISKRPQRYDKCFIKESDVLIEKDDDSTKAMSIKPRIPARLVMNDKTVNAYLDDSLTNKLITFNLAEAEFVRITNEKRCFKLKTNIKSALFCQLDSASGDFVEEWDYDYNLFKHQCRKSRVKSNKILPEQEKLEQEFKARVENIKSDLVQELAQKNKEQVEEAEEVKLTRQVQQVQSTSMMALQKETKLEELLEKEEFDKEDGETKQLEAEILAEKKKEECLNKVIKEKELETQMNVAKSRAEEAIHKIQEQTKKDIAVKRLEVKRKIMEMRKKQERKKAALKSEIMSIRTTLAHKLNTLSKSGNTEICITSVTKDQRQNYCSAHFADSYIKYNDCQNESTFCYVCCENEFGDFHVLERDKCYASCDQNKPSKA